MWESQLSWGGAEMIHRRVGALMNVKRERGSGGHGKPSAWKWYGVIRKVSDCLMLQFWERYVISIVIWVGIEFRICNRLRVNSLNTQCYTFRNYKAFLCALQKKVVGLYSNRRRRTLSYIFFNRVVCGLHSCAGFSCKSSACCCDVDIAVSVFQKKKLRVLRSRALHFQQVSLQCLRLNISKSFTAQWMRSHFPVEDTRKSCALYYIRWRKRTWYLESILFWSPALEYQTTSYKHRSFHAQKFF